MVDPIDEMTVKITADVEGIGDGEAETLTIDTAVAETISELIQQNLRNRYEHIGPDTEVDVLAVSPPNSVAVHVFQHDEEGVSYR